jgi:hypothetical protein
MIRQRAFWMTTVLAVLAATPAWAATDVFQVIPSDALAFVAVNRIADTSGKIEKLAKQLGGKPVKLLDMLKEFTGDIKGLDDARGAALVVMPGKDAKDPLSRVLLVPVTDYKKFLGSWDAKPTEKIVEVTIADEPMLISQRGDYAAMARKEVDGVDFRPGLERLLDAKRSFADEHPQQLAWLNENEVVAVATSHGVKAKSEEMRESMRQAKEILARMNADQDMLAGLEMYAKLFQIAEKEIGFLGVAVRVDKQGDVRLTKRIRFTKNSEFAASLAKLQPTEKGPLVGMPAGSFVLAGGGPWADSLSRSILSFQSDIMKRTFRKTYGISEKEAEALAKKSMEMPGSIHSVSFLMGPGQPGEPIFSDTLVNYTVDDAPKFLDQYAKYLSAMNAPGKEADKAKQLFSVKKTEVGGRPALENEVAVPVPSEAAGVPGLSEGIGKLFGSEGKMKILLVAIDEHNVVINFAGRAPIIMRAIASLKKPADGLATDPEIAKTAALLPTGAQWIGYFSPSGAVAFVKSVLDTLGDDAGFAKPNVPDFPASPPIGVAAKATPGQLEIETVVPSPVLDAIGKYIEQVQGAEHPEVP